MGKVNLTIATGIAMSTKEQSVVYTVSDLARQLKCNRATVWRWAERENLGKILGIGKIRIFTKEEAEKLRSLIYTTPGYPSANNRGIDRKLKIRGSERPRRRKRS